MKKLILNKYYFKYFNFISALNLNEKIFGFKIIFLSFIFIFSNFAFAVKVINDSDKYDGNPISVQIKDSGNVEYDGTAAPFINHDDYIELRLTIFSARANTRHYDHMLSKTAILSPTIKLTVDDKVATWRNFNFDDEDKDPEIINAVDFLENPKDYIPSYFAMPKSCYKKKGCSTSKSSDLILECNGDCPGKAAFGEAVKTAQTMGGMIRLFIPLSDQMKTYLKDTWVVGQPSKINIAITFIQVKLIQKCYVDGKITKYSFKKCMNDKKYITKDATVDYKPSKPVWDGLRFSQTFVFMGGSGGTVTSPLILYFDESRPKFIGVAEENILEDVPIYWPEKKSNAYFLAIDRNGNKIIDKANEVFGSNGKKYDSNGFKVLKKLDTNNDNVIDAKDAEFSKLLLWKDSTGEGRCLEKDVMPLSKMGVTKINLNYKVKLVPYGARAQDRQHSDFEFIKDNKVQKGAIIDVWFGLVGTS